VELTRFREGVGELLSHLALHVGLLTVLFLGLRARSDRRARVTSVTTCADGISFLKGLLLSLVLQLLLHLLRRLPPASLQVELEDVIPGVGTRRRKQLCPDKFYRTRLNVRNRRRVERLPTADDNGGIQCGGVDELLV
jgi:hypothetical protein